MTFKENSDFIIKPPIPTMQNRSSKKKPEESKQIGESRQTPIRQYPFRILSKLCASRI
jgi:hypothetical protein